VEVKPAISLKTSFSILDRVSKSAASTVNPPLSLRSPGVDHPLALSLPFPSHACK